MSAAAHKSRKIATYFRTRCGISNVIVPLSTAWEQGQESLLRREIPFDHQAQANQKKEPLADAGYRATMQPKAGTTLPIKRSKIAIPPR